MKRIIFLGDSITEAFPVESLLPEYTIINKGVFGDRTDLVLRRLESDVIELKPDCVFILVGTNDIAALFSDDALLANYDRMLHTLQNKLPDAHIYSESILPTRGLENRPSQRILLLNSELKKMAEKNNVIFLDIYPWFLDDEGRLAERFSADGLHLTLEGYRRWAEYLRPVLQKEMMGEQ